MKHRETKRKEVKEERIKERKDRTTHATWQKWIKRTDTEWMDMIIKGNGNPSPHLTEKEKKKKREKYFNYWPGH